MWADPNLKDFQGRITRIEKAHAKGYGFEAKGTLGKSSTWKRERSGWRYIAIVAMVVTVGLILKGAIHFYVGAEAYQERVTAMQSGQGFDRVAGTLMQADPVTLAVSSAITRAFGP